MCETGADWRMPYAGGAAEGEAGHGPIPPHGRGGGYRISRLVRPVPGGGGSSRFEMFVVWGRTRGRVGPRRGLVRPGSKEPTPRFVGCYGEAYLSGVCRVPSPVWVDKVEAPLDTLSITGMNEQRYLVSRDGPRWKTQSVLGRKKLTARFPLPWLPLEVKWSSVGAL